MRNATGINLVLLLSGLCCAAEAPLQLVESGRALSSIVVAPDASATEFYAAKVLETTLGQITGTRFSARIDSAAKPDTPIIAIGPAAARLVAPDLDLSLESLGNEGIVIKTVGGHLILSGADGASRGTVYAVHTFLQQLGCRWWSPRDQFIPKIPDLRISELNVRYVPPLEYREVHEIDAFDADWAVRNRINGNDSYIPAEKGGHVVYAKSQAYFVHTFDLLVPPAEHFAAHPEWFTEIDGKRVTGAQLCLTNAELVEFVKQEVRKIAAGVPSNTNAIISVSQNDNSGGCQCAACRAVDEEEGSPSGAMIRFVNAIADDIKTDYPNIAIDTLAYRYTRKPPKLARPLDNVIVRLCSIECSFAQPMTDPVNQAFADDVRQWSKISKRLYVWDYVTNFAHYVQPHPNLYVLGPNVRFLIDNDVKGIFEQGNRHSVGGDFAVLRQWVLAQLLWDPSLNDRQLISDFVRDYYEDAADEVAKYINLRQTAAGEMFIGITDGFDSPWLTPEFLARSYDLLERAQSRVAGNATVANRVELLKAPILHAIVLNWQRKGVWEMLGRTWPLEKDKAVYLDELAEIIRKNQITALSENRTEGDLNRWIDSLRSESVAAPTPPEVANLPRGDWYDLQDTDFQIVGQGNGWVSREKDPQASDGSAAVMPGNHLQWAIQARLDSLLTADQSQRPWNIYASIRVQRGTASSPAGNAFSAGVYDNAVSGHVSPRLTVALSNIKNDEYQWYRIATLPMTHTRLVWIAPENNEQVTRISVDRLLFVHGDVDFTSSRE